LSCETEGQLFRNDLPNCYVRHENVAIVNRRNNTTKTGSDQQEIVCVGRGASIHEVWFQIPVGKGPLEEYMQVGN
jgi:hypothetical protein